MSPRFSLRPRRSLALAGVLLALGSTVAAATGTPSVLLSGTVADPVGDAPASMDLRSLHASYSPTNGSFAATVTMAAAPARSALITVIFGTRDAAGACGVDGPSVTFTAASSDASWRPPGKVATIRTFATDRTVPIATATMSAALTDRAYRAQAWDCASVMTSHAIGDVPIDQTAPAMLAAVPGGRVAVTPGSKTILQLDHGYGYPVDRAHGSIPVTVTCLVAATRRCAGQLTLVQQRSHRALGSARLVLSLGTSKTIAVPVHLTRALKHLHILETRVTVTATHGPSTYTVIEAMHSD
jgi:hypothetical protein